MATIAVGGHGSALHAEDRPKIEIRNTLEQAVAVFWLPENGERKSNGELAAGRSLTLTTTIGHKFVAEAEGFSQSFTATRDGQVIVFTPAALRRPNIVVLMADDWSAPHAGALGDAVVKTPNFDRVVREGVLFENAFVSTPSCTPSRLSVLSGQHHWRLREGDSLGGSLREEYPVYTELLRDAGYAIGRYGKGVWPSKHQFRNRDSFGERFKSLDQFMEQREGDEPFCFWFGGQDPHRPYELGVGERSGIDLASIEVPAWLPDTPEVRGDLADYYWEVQRFDSQFGEVIAALEKAGELDNTLIVVSGDNGMPFPRAKATLYDGGTKVPLAMRWGAGIEAGRTVKDFVSLCDLAPTFLEAAGLEMPADMTGGSLMATLRSSASGQIDMERSFALTGMERHVYPYPSRAIRTAEFLYIRNFEPADWPTGVVEGKNPKYDFADQPWPTEAGAFSHNIDPSPSKQVLRLQRDEKQIKPIAKLSFGQRPDEELYELKNDPQQIHNVASKPEFKNAKMQLRRRLDTELMRSKDPRMKVKGYTHHQVEGWLVLVSDALRKAEPEATEQALKLLAGQCRRVIDALAGAPAALEQLRAVPLWFSPAYEGFGQKAEYHPGADWIEDNGRHPLLTKCVEFTNIPIFKKEIKRMPMVLFHELAHAYHDQVVGNKHPGVVASYREALLTKSYEKVARRNGKPQKAYAITNPQEYFAETSEAYFGQNDFYPFNRLELLEHDPKMFRLLAKLWEGREAQVDAVATDFKVGSPPAELNLDPFYKKHAAAGGYPIVASAGVDDFALREAAYIVDLMLARRPDVRDAMIASGSRLIVMAHDEFSTDIPEYAHMRPKDFWDARARGFGGSRTEPVCSCAEENVLGFPDDPYSTESILIHEFAHNIHLRGMVRVDATFDDRLKEAFDSAMENGLWAGKYAATNRMEYFAEGVQSWFDNNRSDDHDHNHVDTRAELIEYDPGLAAMCEEVFGDTKLVYTKPDQRLTGHLEGYDPSKAPIFVWPEHLLKIKQEIKRKAQLRSDKAESRRKP